MEFKCSELKTWKEALTSYQSTINLLSSNKPDLVSLNNFYCTQLPSLLHSRLPEPYLIRSELHTLMQWKLTRGKFRPRLLDFVASLDEELVKSASLKAFLALPHDLSKAVLELTALKGVGPATASAVLAAYDPQVAPFMSDEAMVAVLGHSKDYSLKQYLLLADKLREKAKELSSEDEQFTASDVERALWSSAVGAKLTATSAKEGQVTSKKSCGRKRKKSS
ncbi:uncharacterized protein LOC130811145 [Amaranthus tricolor]|uniref:uncharacterized protein LOC130811145 n=1 Tax=Amaranthus tricolor TaxID=29722 RepID=UPI00258BC486|nr:uncharacterized protein LOC130811145 [Amaranthus tricolor]